MVSLVWTRESHNSLSSFLQILNKDFEDMEWYKVTAMYGFVAGDKHIDESDSDLLPQIIEKIFTPRLTGEYTDICLYNWRVSLIF